MQQLCSNVGELACFSEQAAAKCIDEGPIKSLHDELNHPRPSAVVPRLCADSSPTKVYFGIEREPLIFSYLQAK